MVQLKTIKDPTDLLVSFNFSQKTPKSKYSLVKPNKEHYSLMFNNCRDNTEDLLNRVCDSRQCDAANMEEAKQMLLNTRLTDSLLILLIVQFVGALGLNLFAFLG